MVEFALRCLLITVTASALLLVASAAWRWRQASPSTRTAKPKPSPDPIPPSLDQSTLAQLAADQAALFSTLEGLTTTVKRLSSRAGMQAVRSRQDTPAVPPVGTPKAELLRFYGMAGKVGPAFAQAQLNLEHTNERPN